MMHRVSTVAVKQLPEIASVKSSRLLFRELEGCLNVNRPRVVLDCSKVSRMDRTAIYLLLCCLEEAIKRNGDVKLAALSAEASEALEVAGVDRVFQIFQTSTDAVNSFHQPAIDSYLHLSVAGLPHRVAEDAA
jgi:anti-anti-sigma factor